MRNLIWPERFKSPQTSSVHFCKLKIKFFWDKVQVKINREKPLLHIIHHKML